MATVGTIAFHRTLNYGAILQLYALQQVLISLGHRPEIIDYAVPNARIASLPYHRRLVHHAWHRIGKKMLVGDERDRRTERFKQMHLRMSSQRFRGFDEIHASPPVFDAYLTGSDQVWNPVIHNNDSSYFLTFAPPGKARLSYAASFGVSKIRDAFAADFSKWLNQIDHISVREAEGKEIIEQLTGREAQVLLDPTLLLEKPQWLPVTVPFRFTRPYVLCYYMPGDRTVNRAITQLADQISLQTGLERISIGQKEYVRLIPGGRSVFNAGPSEFLGLLEGASFVVTNSFHGTALSIGFQKPFLVPINRDLPLETALHSRITSLLTILRLENRLVRAGDDLLADIDVDIDYRTVSEVLQSERKRAMDFLRIALGEA